MEKHRVAPKTLCLGVMRSGIFEFTKDPDIEGKVNMRLVADPTGLEPREWLEKGSVRRENAQYEYRGCFIWFGLLPYQP